MLENDSPEDKKKKHLAKLHGFYFSNSWSIYYLRIKLLALLCISVPELSES